MGQTGSGKKVPEIIRLNRFIANSGVCSRREADEIIRKGLITVNGKKITDLGTKVTYDDVVKYKGRSLSAEKKVYILLNKPKGYVTTVEDPHADQTVLDLIGDACRERVYPVGRLDKNTTGVLLLTNDGDLTGKLTHPKYNRKKVYHVFLDKVVLKEDLFRLSEGIQLEDGLVAADAVSYADQEDRTQIGIELHSGQNRVVRRMFESLGYKVKKLDRVYFAGLTKKNLPRGKWRFLTQKEIIMLKRGIF
ncbi:MAG: pseudouridine synthase [Bacteroidetes bacterium RBG_13_43_22]|nr:MAG: pseudouridine synthase [Bacteroidetes bacterium RBG_13_43_22]